MAKVCAVCGRGAVMAATRSHSQIQTKTKRYLNLQTKTVNGKKQKVCTKCIKTMSK